MSGQLGTARVVDQSERAGERHVVHAGRACGGPLAPLAEGLVGLLAARRDIGIREVGQAGQQIVQLLRDGAEPGLQLLDPVAHGAHLGDELRRVAARALDARHLSRRVVAPRLELLHGCDQLTPGSVEVPDRLQVDGVHPLAERRADRVRLIPDQGDVYHVGPVTLGLSRWGLSCVVGTYHAEPLSHIGQPFAPARRRPDRALHCQPGRRLAEERAARVAVGDAITQFPAQFA